MIWSVVLWLIAESCVVSIASGLSCIECFGARTEQECQAKGKIRLCEYDQDACEIEIREHEGWTLGGMSIFKQCKQSTACDNNHVQNPRDAWWPTQCNMGKRNSVCRCCCFNDMCNVDRKSCFGQVLCPNPPNQIHNGHIECSNGRLPGSQCSVACNDATKLIGNSVVYCTSSGYWSHSFPRCADIMCSQRITIRNGWYSCSRAHFAKSMCRAQCRPGFILHGLILSVCSTRGKWSNFPPLCVPIMCPKSAPVDGGKVECTDKRNVQSRCKTTCDEDRTMKGIGERHCQDNGEWSHDLPTCQEISCPRRRRIPYASLSCTKSWKANSECRYDCDEGFTLRGSSTSLCRLDGKWSQPVPACKRIMCPPRGFLMFGRVRCTSGWFTGSVCRSQCNSGAVLMGDPQSECSLNGTWTLPLPVCERLECPPRGTVEHGHVHCTDRNFVGSRCTVRCGLGWSLEGAETSTCLDSKEWSDPLPSCERTMCALRESVDGGKVRCTDENVAGSRCTVTCDPDKIITGIPSATCREAGEWSAPLADCKRISCPPRKSIEGGIIECSDGNYFGSECMVSCALGKRLSGRLLSVCRRSRRWSFPLPSCLDLTCPPRGKIVGGEVRCSNRNLVGSICSVICSRGRVLQGPPSSICLEAEIWNASLPTCRRITCPFRGALENGIMSCTDSFFYLSVCASSCSQAYELLGVSVSTCLESGEWDNEVPFCKKRTCPPRGDLPHGVVVCSNENNQNSVCEAICDTGYTLIGTSDSECLPTFQWSDGLPICEVNVCPQRGEVERGTVTCSDGQRYGSVCSVICHRESRIFGLSSSECLADGEWSSPLPECELIKCRDLGELKSGKITCTNENFMQSICSFECVEKDYALYPAGRNRAVCQRNERWSVPMPCCSRSCPPYALIDIVVVLDSSSSIGNENWIMLTSFVEGIIRSFKVDRTSANFAIFRYNKIVDVDSQIFLNSFPNDVEGLIAAYNSFEYNGSGTKTGNALQHALTTSLLPENGNRPDVKDVVFVITDGKASDDVASPSDALREMGVTVLVLGIQPPKGFLDLDELRDIAGRDENLVIAEAGFSGLTKEFGLRLSRTICGTPCE